MGFIVLSIFINYNNINIYGIVLSFEKKVSIGFKFLFKKNNVLNKAMKKINFD